MQKREETFGGLRGRETENTDRRRRKGKERKGKEGEILTERKEEAKCSKTLTLTPSRMQR